VARHLCSFAFHVWSRCLIRGCEILGLEVKRLTPTKAQPFVL
jgi:hypothetical protein